MLQNPARNHGRALFSSARPRARLNSSQITNATSTSILAFPLTSTGVTSTLLRGRCIDSLYGSRWIGSRTKATGPAATVVSKAKKLTSDILQTPNPVAKALKDTGIWGGSTLRKVQIESTKPKRKVGRPRKGEVREKDKVAPPEQEDASKTKETTGKKRAAKGDKSRVQITNDELVKDMIDYLKPTLDRNRGCDLISVYPGAGVWTKALHEAVQPRSHLLLEPDESTYRPFLQPLLDQKNVRLVPKSGIIWEDLDAVLTPEYLPNQKPINKKTRLKGPPRNDTLLVSMNLAMFPKKRFGTFQSVSRMVLFQLLQTIRTSTLYQKYGQVRMLIWIPDDEKSGVLPRVIGKRRRIAIEGELATEYIGEVCGRDVAAEDEDTVAKKGAASEGRNHDRWPQMELESARLCKLRMDKQGIVTPPGRSTTLMKGLDTLFASDPKAIDKSISMWEMRKAVGGKGVASATEYHALLKLHKKKKFSADDPNFIRLKALEQYFVNLDSAFQNAVEFNKKHDAVVKAYEAAAQAQAKAKKPGSKTAARLLAHAQELEAEFDATAPPLARYRREYVFVARDAVHILQRQSPDLGPVMSWDRRPYEPLPASANDFFPNIPCALLDIQPKTTHPLLRSMGPGTDNAGDIFDMILGVLMDMMSGSVEKQIATLWPGAVEGVVPQCTALKDPARGGIPLSGVGAITNRCLNGEQLMQILEEFMKWPFRPTHAEILGRLANEEFGDEDAEMAFKGNAAWQTP